MWYGEGNLDPNDPSTDSEIFHYDITTGSISQLTDNDTMKTSSRRVSGSNVVWSGDGNLDPNDPSTDYEIFHYDITTGSITQLTDNGLL